MEEYGISIPRTGVSLIKLFVLSETEGSSFWGGKKKQSTKLEQTLQFNEMRSAPS